MTERLRVVLVEDSDDDAALSLRELRRGGFDVEHRRVQSAQELRDALAEGPWDVVVCDYSLPSFGALEAIAIVQESGLDLPLLIVSGTIGEETAVDALKMGAHDFLVKGRLARLVPAIRRELREVATRRRRREAEESLRGSEERFRTLVESLDDLVFLLDRELRYEGVFGRRVVREGIDRSAIIGKTVTELFEPDVAAVHQAAILRAIAGEQVVYDWSRASTGGPTRSFQTSLSPRLGSTGEIVGLVGVERETTEEKRAEAQLLLSDRLASVGMLAAGVAHEINNPLAAVLGNLEMAHAEVLACLERGDAPQELADVSEEIADALEASKRIATIVRDIKLFSRGGESERTQPMDVRAVLDSSIRMAWNEIRHRARIVREYDDVPLVEAAESRLGQVFLNLIVNAAQAIPEGRAEGNVIRVSAERVGDRVRVSVRDTGTGMPPHVLRQLFTPFFTTKAVGVGTGLGLSICHRIVTSLGGEIEVESQTGLGSTFHVFLPMSTAAAAPREQPAKKRSSASARPGKGTVLVIDDDEGVCEVVRRMIDERFDVVTTTSSREALGWIRDGARYDVVLCDLMMPELPGVELYELLREVAPDQIERLVFMTGGVFSSQARAFVTSTAQALLEKPFDREAVNRAIERCLA